MVFALRFTNTHKDLVDGFDADLTARTGMRPWVRGAVIAVGLAWLLGVVAVFAFDLPVDHWWRPIVWFVLAALILTQLLIKPQLARRRIGRANAPSQDVHLNVSDSGIDVMVAGIEPQHLSWFELDHVNDRVNGIALAFGNGHAHWIPNRAFSGPEERATFLNFVVARIPAESADRPRIHHDDERPK